MKNVLIAPIDPLMFGHGRLAVADLDELSDRFAKELAASNAVADSLTLPGRAARGRAKLTPDQRMNLAIKTVIFEQSETHAERVARLASLIAYVASERIAADDIKHADWGTDRLVPAITAATAFENPRDIPVGSLGGEALVTAGFAAGPDETGDGDPPVIPRDTTSSSSEFPF